MVLKLLKEINSNEVKFNERYYNRYKDLTNSQMRYFDKYISFQKLYSNLPSIYKSLLIKVLTECIEIG